MTPHDLAACIHEQMLARTAELNVLVREAARIVKAWPVAQRNALMKLLWETGKLESGASSLPGRCQGTAGSVAPPRSRASRCAMQPRRCRLPPVRRF